MRGMLTITGTPQSSGVRRILWRGLLHMKTCRRAGGRVLDGVCNCPPSHKIYFWFVYLWKRRENISSFPKGELFNTQNNPLRTPLQQSYMAHMPRCVQLLIIQFLSLHHVTPDRPNGKSRELGKCHHLEEKKFIHNKQWEHFHFGGKVWQANHGEKFWLCSRE